MGGGAFICPTLMAGDVQQRLADLPKMRKSQLIALWEELFNTSPPPRLRSELMIPILAYRIQEQAYGGLSQSTRNQLRELARKFEANPNAEISPVRRVAPGTRLIRDWHGRSHHVTVLDKGYEYAGTRYSSLSEIARLITGSRWSGPLFFGLRGSPSRESARAQ
jgi:hypothetical protein